MSRRHSSEPAYEHPGHEHEHRLPDARPEVSRHPLLDLQRQVGNAAVTSMLQRHSLDPEEEAGS